MRKGARRSLFDKARGPRTRAIDKYVGGRVRIRRIGLGMTQRSLAKSIGVTFQQLQKYEVGVDRIVASRLFDFSKSLNVPIEFFFADMPAEIAATALKTNIALPVPAKTKKTNRLMRRGTSEFIKAYYNITNLTLREHVYELAIFLGRMKSGGKKYSRE